MPVSQTTKEKRNILNSKVYTSKEKVSFSK